jgi:ATP-binding cassette, subfamily F, member 3
MITVSDLAKSFGDRELFSGVSLQINRGDRIGLIGPNGSGKSTLFSLLLEADHPDDGTIAKERDVTVGHLPQETAPIGDETVLELATAISEEMVTLRQKLRMLESDPDHHDDNYHEWQTRFDHLGGYQLEPRAKTILKGLAFRDRDFDRPLREMSGGWIMRAHLARLLVQQPDLLMLDEPTNHLDLEALIWFQDYIKTYPGALLLISHDRSLLNEVINTIYELRQQQVFQYRGNYDTYLRLRDEQQAQQEAAYKNQQRKIEQLQRFADRFRAKASKAAQAQAKLKQIERMDKIEAPEESNRTVRFQFPQPPRSGRRVIALRDIHHAYGENIVYRNMQFEAERGQRIVLVGPNGAGKSTLMKLLAGVLPVQQGAREPGLHVKVGYYAQHRVEMLHSSRTVLEEASSTDRPLTEQFIRTVLGSFLFTGDDVFKPVRVLSGGEKSRLALVKLLLDPPNLLLMDEPTTHLDMASIDALINALQPFEGTLIFISHDVYFIRKLARTVLHVQDGALTWFPGDYGYYLDKREGHLQPSPAAAPTGPSPKSNAKERRREEAENRQSAGRMRKEQQKRIAQLEKRIMDLETRQQTLTEAMEDPATYQDAGKAVALNRELMAVVEDLQRTSNEWEKAVEAMQLV